MASLETRLEDPGYKFLVKSGICLAYAKHGLDTFAYERSKRTHGIIKGHLIHTASHNNICPHAKPIPVNRQGKLTLGCCVDCDIYLSELGRLGSPGFKFKTANWKNSNVQLWPTDAWEMMKVYMNEGQKPYHKLPKDSDLSAVLNFMDYCFIPRCDINDPTNIAKVRISISQ